MTKLPEFQQTVVLEYDAATADTIRGRSNAGAPVWTALATVKALIYPISMKFAVEAAKVGLFSTYRVIADYDDLSALSAHKGKPLRAKYDGKIFRVLECTDVGGQNKFYQLELIEWESQ